MWNRVKQGMESMNVAFSMYSAIPMPQIEWTPANMKYAMCFFPLVGAAEGAALLLWFAAGKLLPGLHAALWAAVAVGLPLLITGGIHLDGFCDTVDALSSRQSRERKLEILKDSHTGAFAVMGCVLYLLLSFSMWVQLEGAPFSAFQILACGFVLSRSFSGLSVVTFPCAKSSGLAAAFSHSAEKRRVQVTLTLVLLVCIGLMLWSSPLLGSVTTAVTTIIFLYYYWMSRKQFGGITGDLAGYFLQMAELGQLAAVSVCSAAGMLK